MIDATQEKSNIPAWISIEEACKLLNLKEKTIKEVIDSYEGRIPEPYYSRLREAMYNYRVEIDD